MITKKSKINYLKNRLQAISSHLEYEVCNNSTQSKKTRHRQNSASKYRQHSRKFKNTENGIKLSHLVGKFQLNSKRWDLADITRRPG